MGAYVIGIDRPRPRLRLRLLIPRKGSVRTDQQVAADARGPMEVSTPYTFSFVTFYDVIGIDKHSLFIIKLKQTMYLLSFIS